MQRRDPSSFFEGVLAQVPGISATTRAELLALVPEKAGTKRAARIAALLAGSTDEADRADAAK